MGGGGLGFGGLQSWRWFVVLCFVALSFGDCVLALGQGFWVWHMVSDSLFHGVQQHTGSWLLYFAA